MFDLAIIGGGPAGYTAAERAAHGGMNVILFEKQQLGGVCLNEGCIPTKTMLYSAKLFYNAQNGAKYGISCAEVSADYEKIVARKNKIVRKLNAGIRAKMTEHGVTVINGEAKVTTTGDTFQIVCNDEIYTAKNILIATGSETAIPPIKGVESAAFWTSREALETKQVPSSLIVIGGGVIGLEFAGLFQTFGCRVSVVEMADEILPSVDREIAAMLRADDEKKGIRFHLSARVTELNGTSVRFSDAEGEQQIDAEQILMCVGRRPRLAGVEELDLRRFRNGLEVDDRMHTSLPNVYAAGDVTGFSLLAHTAVREAEVAVNTMLGRDDAMSYKAVPAVVYTNPEVAGIGATEEEMQAKKRPYRTLKLPMTFSGRFVAENEGGNGLCKLVVDNENRVIGAHLIGNPASELIATAAVAIEQGMTVGDFKKIIFPHPSVGEIFKETLFVD